MFSPEYIPFYIYIYIYTYIYIKYSMPTAAKWDRNFQRKFVGNLHRYGRGKAKTNRSVPRQ